MKKKKEKYKQKNILGQTTKMARRRIVDRLGDIIHSPDSLLVLTSESLLSKLHPLCKSLSV